MSVEKKIKTNLYDLVMSHDVIYSLMYAPHAVSWRSREDQIIEIDTKDLKWSKDKATFYYIWGWPGPDFNTYELKDYGSAWAFTKDEVMNYSRFE